MSLDQIGQYERNKIKERAPRSINDQAAAQSGGQGMKACFATGPSEQWETSNGAIGAGKEKQLQPRKTQLQQARDERGPSQAYDDQEQQPVVRATGSRGQANRQTYNILTGGQ